jgi:hypothetical protein
VDVVEPEAFVVRTTRWGWLALAFLALVGLLLTGLVLSVAWLGVDPLRGAPGTRQTVRGVVALGLGAGGAAAAVWYLRSQGARLVEEIGRPGAVTVSLGESGVRLGQGRVVPWSEVGELVVAERDVGGDGAGSGGYAPYLVVLPWPGPGSGERGPARDAVGWGPSASLRDDDAPGDVTRRIAAVVRRYAPGVPVTDVREHPRGR